MSPAYRHEACPPRLRLLPEVLPHVQHAGRQGGHIGHGKDIVHRQGAEPRKALRGRVLEIPGRDGIPADEELVRLTIQREEEGIWNAITCWKSDARRYRRGSW